MPTAPHATDLQARIALGTGFLARSLDPDNGFPNILMLIEKGQAWHIHDFADFGDLTARYLEAAVLAATVPGIKLPDQLRSGLEKHFYSYFKEDGLSYRPEVGGVWRSTMARRNYEPGLAEGFDQSRVMYTLLALHREANDPRAQPAFTRLIRAIRAQAVMRKDDMYFTGPTFRANSQTPPSGVPYPQQLYFAQTMIHPLAYWWQLTGDDLALDTARRLARFVTRDATYFGPDGSFEALRTPAPGSWDLINGHTHSRLGALAGLIALGHLTGDAETLAFGKRAFDWFRTNHVLNSGWCPEFLGRHPLEQEGCETCALMDLLHCGQELVAAGYPEYWGLIERLVRNQLPAQQLLDERFLPPSTGARRTEFSRYPIAFDAIRGGFAGWGGVNDLIGPGENGNSLMHCCGPSGVKALCLAWRDNARFEKGTLRIALRLPHQSDLATVRSFEPAEGRLEIEPLRRGALRVRLPDRTPREAVRTAIDAHPVPATWIDGELALPGIAPGQTIRIDYPLLDRSLVEHVGSVTYESRWRGETMLAISPAGKRLPLYQLNLS